MSNLESTTRLTVNNATLNFVSYINGKQLSFFCKGKDSRRTLGYALLKEYEHQFLFDLTVWITLQYFSSQNGALPEISLVQRNKITNGLDNTALFNGLDNTFDS
jgi:hypothetical protein